MKQHDFGMDGSTWAVRRATVDDAHEVGQLLHDFNTEFDTPSPGAVVLASRLRTLLATPSTFALLAEAPAVAVALVTLRSNVWFDGPVALRSRGIGGAIMTELHAVAESMGVGLIEINVDESDHDAQRFYRRHGFDWSEPDSDERAFYFFKELDT